MSIKNEKDCPYDCSYLKIRGIYLLTFYCKIRETYLTKYEVKNPVSYMSNKCSSYRRR